MIGYDPPGKTSQAFAEHVVRRLIAVLLLVIGAGESAAEAPPASGPMAGFVRYEFNKWLFFPCVAKPSTRSTAGGMPFIDATSNGALSKVIQQRWQQSADPSRGVYLEFSGYQESQRVSATELWRALGWVESCAKRPTNVKPSAVLWAAGNEPSWSFTLDDTQAVFQQMGSVPKRFPPLARKTVGRTTTWQSRDAATGLRVEFIDELCTDTMSEAVFGRKVVLTGAGKQFTGCGFVR